MVFLLLRKQLMGAVLSNNRMKFMSNKILNWALMALLALNAAACGTARKAALQATPSVTPAPMLADTATAAPALSRAAQIAATFGGWQTVQAGGSLTVSGGKSLTSSMNVRMERGRSISISVRPMGLVEVARLVIKGDTLIAIDKLHKRYLCENVQLLTAGLPADVSTVQDMLLGRAFVLGHGTYNTGTTHEATVLHVNADYLLQPREQLDDFSYQFRFDAQNRLLALEVTPKVRGVGTLTVNYADVQRTVAGNIAGRLSFATRTPQGNVALKLDYSGFTWNQPVKIDTTIPKNYSKIDGSYLLKMLGQQ